MINITNFSFTEDLKNINLVFNSGTIFTSMLIYVGDAYLTDKPKDLSDKLNQATSYSFTGLNAITPADLGLPEGEPLSGIFIVELTNSDTIPEIKEAGIASDYLLTLCLANKTIQQNQEGDLNETSYLFLLLEAYKIYMTETQFEQALSAYARAKAVCNTYKENYSTDILPCGEGTGCWIINGVYIVKK